VTSSPSLFSFLTVSLLVVTIWLGVTLAARKDIGRGYAAILMYIPALLGALLVNLLPSHNKVGLLLSYWVVGTFSFQGQIPARWLTSVRSFRLYAIRHSSGLGPAHHLRAHKAYVRFSSAPSWYQTPILIDPHRNHRKCNYYDCIFDW